VKARPGGQSEDRISVFIGALLLLAATGVAIVDRDVGDPLSAVGVGR
jgi:hypothetical protein